MNAIWISVIMISIGSLMFTNVDAVFPTLLTGSEKAVALALKLWAIYAIWLGILRILEETKLNEKIAKLLKPFIRKVIGKYDQETENQIAINIVSNVLGMGNASTPSGINALGGMSKGETVATSGMLVFLILNTANLQLIPTTIIGLRILSGSKTPTDIIFPVILSSLISCITGILLIKILSKIKFLNRHKQKDKLIDSSKRFKKTKLRLKNNK